MNCKIFCINIYYSYYPPPMGNMVIISYFRFEVGSSIDEVVFYDVITFSQRCIFH